MGLGRVLHRAVTYQATNTVTGHSETFVIEDRNPLAPQWSTAGYRSAMAIPGVWRSATLLSDLIGGLPWDAYRTRRGGVHENIASPLLDQPSPPDTRVTTFSGLALDVLFHGNGIAVYTARNSDGYPTAMVPVSADVVGIRRTGGRVEYEIDGRVFGHEDILHVKGPAKPGDLRGMGVLENHFDTLDLARELNRQARNVNDSGVPTGKLKVSNPEATEDDLKKTKAGWLEAQRNRTVAVLNATTDFEPLAWNPTETQLLEARKFSLHEIALIFGLPLSYLGVEQSSRTYTNTEQEAINLLKTSLQGHITRFEQALSLAFPRGTTVKANLDGVLRADTLTRYQAHAIALDKGFLTVNEVRELENRPPLPEVKPTTEGEGQ